MRRSRGQQLFFTMSLSMNGGDRDGSANDGGGRFGISRCVGVRLRDGIAELCRMQMVVEGRVTILEMGTAVEKLMG